MAPVYGRMDEYVFGTDWNEYVERLYHYFTANEIADRDKQKSIFLTVCGAQTYSLLRKLLTPENPATKTLRELCDIIQDHVNPRPLVIAERYKMHKRKQKSTETVNEFMAELRRLSEYCEYGNFLNQALRDFFVVGLQNQAIQQKLLTEANLTVERALDIAIGMEAAEKQTKELFCNISDLSMSEKSVNQVRERPRSTGKSDRSYQRKFPSSQTECWRCGKAGHNPDDCYHRNATCHKCQRTGHLSRKCRGEKVNRNKKPQRKGTKRHSHVQMVRDEENSGHSFSEDSDISDDASIFTVKLVKSDRNKEIVVPLEIESIPVNMELDTGASVSIMSERHYKEKFKNIPLLKSSVMLKTYTNEPLKVLGEISVSVKYQQQTEQLKLCIVPGKGPMLFGRNWLSKFKLNWSNIRHVNMLPDRNSLMSEFKSVFDGKLGTVKDVKVHLQVKEKTQPKFCKPRPVPYALRDKISDELDRLVSAGVLEKVSYSDWATPIVPVMKPDRTVRICGDYKVTLNPVLDVPEYPTPKPEELFTALNGGQKFTKMDLSHAYQQVLLDAESTEYVTINTHKGIYRYTRLPYGVSSSPALFQEVMDKVLQGLPGVVKFMDDLSVTGKNDAEHCENVRNVLRRFEEFNIKLKKEKFEFMKNSINFLGFVIDANGIRPSTVKVKAIVDAPQPQNKAEVQSLLGLINYYRKFLPQLSSMAAPLNNLLKKDIPFNWCKQCEAAFKQVKDSLISSDLLVYFDPTKPLTLATDASPYGIGAVISHTINGEERPIEFASRTLTVAERNYSQIEREALAIIFGVERFHQYLYGTKFTLLTDHKPLTIILGEKKGIPTLAASRLQRWAIKLSAYQYAIKFRTSKQNANADVLSRLPIPDIPEKKVTDVWTYEANNLNYVQVNSLPINVKQISQATTRDKVLARVKQFTIMGWPTQDLIPDELLPYYRKQNELSCEEGCLLWGVRVVVPEPFRNQVLDLLHESHPGIVKMKSLARMHVWWPNIDSDIEQQVLDCIPCQSTQTKPSIRSNPWIWPDRPFQRVHIDFAGPFLNQMFLIAVDARSKWPEVIPMTTTTATATVNVLRNLFSSYGIPEQIVSDNGPQFTASEFDSFTKANGIKHIKSAVYHPSSNGEAERFVRTFKTTMKTLAKSPGTVNQKLCQFLLSYRTTPHSSTKVTPTELFLGRRLRTRLNLMLPNLTSTMMKNASPEADKTKSLESGSVVLVRDYRNRQNPTWIRGVIIQKLGPVTYQVEVGNNIWKRHADQLIDISLCKNLSENVTPELPVLPDTQLPIQRKVVTPFPLSSTTTNEKRTPDERLSNNRKPTESIQASSRNRPVRLRNPPKRLIETM